MVHSKEFDPHKTSDNSAICSQEHETCQTVPYWLEETVGIFYLMDKLNGS